MLPTVTNYAIVLRKPNGQVKECQPRSAAYAYLASCITLAIYMLLSPRAYDVLTDMAWQLDSAMRNIYRTRARAEEVVRMFLRGLGHRFPVLVIDYQLTESGAQGQMNRGGAPGTFNARDHFISLNAAVCTQRPLLVELFLTSWGVLVNVPISISRILLINSSQNVWKMRNAVDRRRMDHFRTWQFSFANTIFHECGHLLVTVVGGNSQGCITPPHIRPDIAGYSDESCGEAGRVLEERVLGGVLETYQDPNQGDEQVCLV